MKKLLVNFTYTLTPQWLQQFGELIGVQPIDNKIILLSDEVAEGRIYFLELMPGLSVMLRDMFVHQPIRLSRKAKGDDLVFVYYDMSENINTHIVNGVGHRVGLNSPFDLGIIDSSVESTYIPVLEDRIYSLCLFVSKKLMVDLLKSHGQKNNKKVYFDPDHNTLLFYGRIDSRSRLLLRQLKNKSYEHPSFELFFKSTSYRLEDRNPTITIKDMEAGTDIFSADIKELMKKLPQLNFNCEPYIDLKIIKNSATQAQITIMINGWKLIESGSSI